MSVKTYQFISFSSKIWCRDWNCKIL